MLSLSLGNLDPELVDQLIIELVEEIEIAVYEFTNFSEHKRYVFEGMRDYSVDSLISSLLNFNKDELSLIENLRIFPVIPAITIIEMLKGFVIPFNFKLLQSDKKELWINLVQKFIPSESYWVLFSDSDFLVNEFELNNKNKFLQIGFSDVDIYTASYLKRFAGQNNLDEIFCVHPSSENPCDYVLRNQRTADHWVCEYSGPTVLIPTWNREKYMDKRFFVRIIK